jgi:hypothetical protein
MSYEITIKSLDPQEWQKLATLVQKLENEQHENGKPITITATNEINRTAAQNRLLNAAYYPAIAEAMGDKDEEEVAARCKRKFGVNLMRIQAQGTTKKALKVKRELLRFGLIPTDSQTKQAGWVQLMPVMGWPQAAQLEAFKLMECTRNFNTKEFSEYINRIEIWAAQELGLRLESINETLRNNALNIK